MKTLITAVLLAVCASGTAWGAEVTACEARAVDKNGKPLSGAAKISFLRKCERELAPRNDCEAAAVSADGKPLYGAARTSSIQKCEQERAAANANR